MEDAVTKSDTATIICWSIFGLLMFIVGLYLNIKIIKVSRKDKDMTWKLDITHSIIVILSVTHSIVMYSLTYFIDNLYRYTGEWFCYTSKILDYYGHLYIAGHSLIVVILKYVLIVRWQWARNIGNDRIKEIFFWINFLHPVVTILSNLVVRPDFFWAYDGMKHADICLGDPKNNWVPDRNHSLTKLHNLCEFVEPPPENYLEYSIFIAKSSLCWLNVVVFYLVMFNVIEMIFYCVLFRFMRRYVF